LPLGLVRSLVAAAGVAALLAGAAWAARSVPVVAVGASVLSKSSGASRPSEAVDSSAPAATPVLTDCRVSGLEYGVKCGFVERPLDPVRPDGTRITIRYVVAPALARRHHDDPVFMLAGGPGQSAIELASAVLPLLQRLNNRRDIVFVDQRGTGRSAPLDCSDTGREPWTDAADPQRQLAELAACRERLQRLPYIRQADDLGFFTTSLAVQDLDAVRRQLGAQRINLIGGSYGTRVELEYLRQFPQAVRRSVLDGVAPPDMALPASFSTDGQAAFDAMLAACEAEAACRGAHPRLRAQWHALLERLPQQALVRDPLTGVPRPLDVTRGLLLGAVRGPLYVPALAAGLPVAIEAAANGDWEPLLGLSAMLQSPGGGLAMGMHFSVICAEDVPRLATTRDAPGSDFGRDMAELYRKACAEWPRGPVPAGFYEIPRSASPALLLSGGLDPATPPRHGAPVTQALGPMARHVLVANAGHGVMAIGCMPDVIHRFIEAGDDHAALGVDTACVEAVPRPPAYRPVERSAQTP
jgi:pimeloyl-ACP methyl ester carboxylesterase